MPIQSASPGGALGTVELDPALVDGLLDLHGFKVAHVPSAAWPFAPLRSGGAFPLLTITPPPYQDVRPRQPAHVPGTAPRRQHGQRRDGRVGGERPSRHGARRTGDAPAGLQSCPLGRRADRATWGRCLPRRLRTRGLIIFIPRRLPSSPTVPGDAETGAAVPTAWLGVEPTAAQRSIRQPLIGLDSLGALVVRGRPTVGRRGRGAGRDPGRQWPTAGPRARLGRHGKRDEPNAPRGSV